jgi:hypothetical protein
MNKSLNEEIIASIIYFIRGEKVLLDSDLAILYGVPTKVLKQAVKRNIERFPDDFMFELNQKEYDFLRSQFVTLEEGRGKHSKYLPMVFSEQGVAMLSGILKSKRAIQVNIGIMRTFVQIRKLLHGNMELTQKIKELEKMTLEKFEENDEKFQSIFEAINLLIQVRNEPGNPIGFKI